MNLEYEAKKQPNKMSQSPQKAFFSKCTTVQLVAWVGWLLAAGPLAAVKWKAAAAASGCWPESPVSHSADH